MKSEPSTDGVTVPEDFQKKVHELVHNAPKAHLQHMSDRIYARHDELRKQAKSAKSPKEMEYSTEDMPASN